MLTAIACIRLTRPDKLTVPLEAMLREAKAQGREVRGPVDDGFIRSIYLRDPNGYVVELTASTGTHTDIMDPAQSRPHAVLARWEQGKSAASRLTR
jgi:hypothetical protein